MWLQIHTMLIISITGSKEVSANCLLIILEVCYKEE